MKKFGIILLVFFIVSISNSNAQVISKEDSLKLKDSFYYFNGLLPGAIVSIVSNGNEIYYRNFGLANNDTKEKISRNHFFNISLMGRMYTAMAILKLEEMNKLSLDESLTDIFPDFPKYGENITVKNLLSHTSGLVNYDPLKISTNKELLKYLYIQDSLTFQPGSQWSYSNSDFPILASIIEVKSKMAYQKFLKKHIFKNLKISKKQFFDEFKAELLVSGHNEKSWNYTVVNDAYSKIYGEKGIFLTIDDLLKTENAIFYNKNNPVENYNKSFEKFKTINAIEINFGLGWYIVPQDKENTEKTIYWIGGKDHGMQTVIVHFPVEKLSVILIINRDHMYTNIVKMAVDIGKLVIE
ncbi:MAG: hypothetical protein A2041_02450 [Bacteroidetes bacterium GWA2_31_9b]|nr:MAG: hypothetical protein A2041_02450 [Bacteroidetes bacterium GWA2_31_9b]